MSTNIECVCVYVRVCVRVYKSVRVCVYVRVCVRVYKSVCVAGRQTNLVKALEVQRDHWGQC